MGSMASRMGIEPGFLVLESGQGSDADEALRSDMFKKLLMPFFCGGERTMAI
jgi:hypothetical protein